jgi:hypothetical protein
MTLGLAAGRPSESRKKQAMASMAIDAKTVRVNFDLDEAQFTRFKMQAVQSKRTMADILRELVAKELSKAE